MGLLKNFTNFNDEFKLENTIIEEMYLCGLCNNVMYRTKATKCGCNFCEACITTYLNGTKKLCPKCKQEEIGNENDIVDDFKMERNIKKLIVICQCNEKYNLDSIQNHLDKCSFNNINKCIFRKFGCRYVTENEEEINPHLLNNLQNHFERILKHIGDSDIENSVDEKIQLTRQEIENNFHQEQRKQCDKIEKISEESNKLNKEINDKIDKQSDELKEEIEKLKADLKELQHGRNRKQKRRLEVGEMYIAEPGEVRMIFTDINNKKKNIWYDSEVFNVENYQFKVQMYLNAGNRWVMFNLHLIASIGDIDDLEWPLRRKMEFVLIRKDGVIHNHHVFGYDIGLDECKQYYHKPIYDTGIRGSGIIAVSDFLILNNTINIIFRFID